MALTLDEIQATTNDFFDSKKAQDNYFDGNLFFMRLLGKAKKISGGEKIRVPLTYDKLNGGSFTAGDTFNTAKKDIINAARFPWAYYYVNVTYDIDDKVQNSGAAAEVDIISTKLQNAQDTIKDLMGTDLYGSSDYDATNRKLNGLPALFQNTSSVEYGGIAEDDMAKWLANYTTTASTMGLALLRTIRRTGQVGNKQTSIPTIYPTTPTNKDAFEAVLQPQQRFTDAKLAKSGFDNVAFGTAPVVGDMKCTASSLFAMNENHIGFRVHTAYNFKREGWNRPTNQEIFVMQIIWAGQFICSLRRAHVQYTAVSA